MLATNKISEQEKYKGQYPSVFKKFDPTNFKRQQFVTNKLFTFVSGSTTASAMPLSAIYTSRDNLPALGSELTFNDAANIDGSLQSVTYFSVDHLYYSRKQEPSKTFGPTDLTRTKKHLYESASVFVIPQNKIGEGIQPASFTITYEFNTTEVVTNNLTLPATLPGIFGV